MRVVPSLLLLFLVACRPLDPGAPELSPAFPFGVASGDPAAEAVELWTRYQGSAPVRVELWEAASGLSPGADVRSLSAVPAEGGFVQLRADGLRPATEYRFRFTEDDGGEQSRVGRFRTAPFASAPERLVFGVLSCMNDSRAFTALESAASGAAVDAFLFLGDTVYADRAKELPQYRREWEQNLAIGGLREVRAAAAMVATWDDHEVVNNWSGDSVDAARVAAGIQAFYEAMPVRRDPQRPDKLWRSMRWGTTAELFVLDSRSERRPATRQGPDATYLSEEQLRWLEDGLATSPARFKLVLTSVPISDFPGLLDAAADDRWEGYPAQRTRLLQFIEQNALRGVVFIAGDFHLGALGRVSPPGMPGASLLEVTVGPAANFVNGFASLLTAPQFDWAVAQNNYALLHLDPVAGSMRVAFHAESGALLFERTYYP